MRGQGVEVDVKIEELCRVLGFRIDPNRTTYMQQRVGAVISRVNGKMEGLCIVPGMLKRTYRLMKSDD